MPPWGTPDINLSRQQTQSSIIWSRTFKSNLLIAGHSKVELLPKPRQAKLWEQNSPGIRYSPKNYKKLPEHKEWERSTTNC